MKYEPTLKKTDELKEMAQDVEKNTFDNHIEPWEKFNSFEEWNEDLDLQMDIKNMSGSPFSKVSKMSKKQTEKAVMRDESKKTKEGNNNG